MRKGFEENTLLTRDWNRGTSLTLGQRSRNLLSDISRLKLPSIVIFTDNKQTIFYINYCCLKKNTIQKKKTPLSIFF